MGTQSIFDHQNARHTDFRKASFGSLDVSVDRREDGSIYINSKQPLGPYPRTLTERLCYWASVAPDRTFLAQRVSNGDWRRLRYGEALECVRRIGTALLKRKLSSDRPLVILSGNDLEHAMLALAALHVGISYAPVSPAYSTVSTDFANLRQIVNLLRPGMVFAADGVRFGDAIEAVVSANTEVLVTAHPLARRPSTLFSEILSEPAGDEAETAYRAVTPDTIAKILFTSGSTNVPKGVVNTQRMLCSNQEMIRSVFAFFATEPPIILDWSPWHHTAGGNGIFGEVLYNGGTLYIDDGKPTPDGIHATVRNLRDIHPTVYFNVPVGFEALIPFLRADEQLRRNLFCDLKLLLYAGANMARHVWDALEELSIAASGGRTVMLTGFGSTETAPFALNALPRMSGAGVVGLPVPGVHLKLVPVEGKLEARIKGPNVTPGYWRDPGLTNKAFDEEGYFRFGDALKFADPHDVGKGLVFDGRLTENFKLATGTWVHVGALRAAFINAFAPLVQDVVITGADRNEIGALIFPVLSECRRLCPEHLASARPSDVLIQPAVLEVFQARLDRCADEATGSSNRITRALLVETPPSLDRGEITDKGSLNQRAVLKNRSDLVELLYANPCPDRVLFVRRKLHE
jgi:feruloyl-CoA synthase